MKYKEGEPCEHPGCLNHVTHPCEGCGRIAGHIRKQDYEKYEFCKAINCPLIEYFGKCCIAGCLYTAKDFHQWLQDSGYKIVKETKNEV